MKPWREQLHQDVSWGRRIQSPVIWIIATAVVVLVVGWLILSIIQKMENQRSVTVYTSQDKVHAEQLFLSFSEATGIKVRAVYDSEAVKTVGIVNRLFAERNNPQCDVFWNNEELRTRQLAAEGVFDASDDWRSFGYRSRRLVINTNRIRTDEAPRRFGDLTNQVWRGKFALAYPLFGMTATHFMALRNQWGGREWREWCEALQANEPMVVDGNSVVVRQVGRGEVWIGMTDFDDIAAGQKAGYPIAALPIALDALLVPNTVALVAGAPNRQNGQQFIEWLTKRETMDRLVEMGALEGVEIGTFDGNGLSPDWSSMLENLEMATDEMRQTFLR